MSEIKFIDGTKVKKIKDEFYGISFSKKFIEYFKQNQKNGYLNVNLCKSKDKDKWYLRLNEWTPDKKDGNITNADKIDVSDFPF